MVSGGHTELVYVSEAGDYKIVGETRDDAVGEAYDKVGRVMGLTYPAGREIDELAHQGQDIYDFPRAMIKEDNLEFSFSGLKSAFINLHHNAEQREKACLQRTCVPPSKLRSWIFLWLKPRKPWRNILLNPCCGRWRRQQIKASENA